ncbi:GspE/PulE family protein [Trichlorobacter sp.]|uniref:GspE/PulE family protein n=1 Tax=Trichlorobacter sp. TaxID=2911007 RepID=UPI002A36BE10|nr:ATPase, T2SS/T4P/T4SS family [Trichlorobacter sp.]MDY0383714.1 ATPase, T2SS/T4P/T4SS family [Trichlorobacter sp.]
MHISQSDTHTRIGDYLRKQGLITQQKLDVALQEQAITGEKLGEVLIRFGFFERSHLVEALAYLNPESLIGETSVQVELPPEFLLQYRCMILGDTGNTLYLATLHPHPHEVLEAINRQLDFSMRLKLVPIRHTIIAEHLVALEHSMKSVQRGQDSTDINKQLADIIHDALEEGASDIHLEASEKTLHIRYRIDGILHTVKVLPESLVNKIFSRIKDMSGMNVSDKMVPQDGSFSFNYRGRNVDFRVSTIPSTYGEKATIRILDKEKMMIGVQEIGITSIGDWLDLAQLTTGLVLVCGATGSGKTTTLYSTVRHLNLLEKAVYFVEDPVEYRVPFVTQVQVNRRINLDFAAFGRTVLRHDPDVVIVGEIRDAETAENALWLADTGHLVYATLHTNDIPSTILRLKDLGAEIPKLSYALRGVLVQKLARKLCAICDGDGCDECRGTGYRGRTLLTEFARLNEPGDIYRLIDHTTGNPLEYLHFIDDARHKLATRVTDCAEIHRVLGIRLGGTWCNRCRQQTSCNNALEIID